MLIARQQPRWSSNHLQKLKTFSFTGFFRRWQTDQDLCQVTTFLSLHCRCQINPFCTFVCQASIFLILLNQTLSPLTDLRSLRPKWMRQSWSPTPCGSPTRFALHLKNWVFYNIPNFCYAVHGRPGALDGVHQRAAGGSQQRDLHRPSHLHPTHHCFFYPFRHLILAVQGVQHQL